MFLEKQKVMDFLKQKMECLLAAVLTLTMLATGSFPVEVYAETGKKQRLHVEEQLAEGQYFSKTYDLDVSTAGKLVAKVKAKGIGSGLRLTIYGSNSDYFIGHIDLPENVIRNDAKGNVSGSLQTNHIMMADNYHLLVQSTAPIKGNGRMELDFYCKKSSVEDYEYAKNGLNNTRNLATDFNINDKKTHQFLLSGYREQKDLSDCYKFHVDKAGYLALRVKSISNTGKVPYAFYLYSTSENRQLAVFNNPGQALKTKLVKVKPGDYCIEVLVNDASGIIDHQIVYSLYAARAKNIKAVTLNKKKVKLYAMNGYCKDDLTVKVDGKKVGSNTVRYKSSSPSIVSVNQKGALIAKKSGKAVISCYAIDKPKVKAKCRVMVADPSLKISSSSKTFFVGGTAKLSVKKFPKRQKVSWKTTNAKVATVSAKGVVKGKKPGTAKVYAVSDAGAKSAKCRIVVKKKPQPKPQPKPTPDPNDSKGNTDRIRLVLTLSSAHLSPTGVVKVNANVVGGTFFVSGGIAIKSRNRSGCVIYATTNRGSGTVTYVLNGNRASKNIIIY